MPILSSVNCKALLIGLVCNAVSDFWTKHHLIACHEIEHNIFQNWHECIGANKVEVDFIIGGNLDSHITLYIVYETSYFKHLILFPFSLFSLLVLLNLKEKDVWWASGDQSGVVDEVHLAKIHFSHSIKEVLARVLGLNDKSLSLSIKWVNLIFLIIIKTFVWKVFLGAG